MEVIRNSHLRQIHRLPYTAYVPTHAVRRTEKTPTVESLLWAGRLNLWATACRDSPHSFFRAAMFGTVEGENANQRLRTPPLIKGLFRPLLLSHRVTLC